MRFVLWGAMLSSALVGLAVTATSPQAAGLDGLHAKIQVGNRLCMAGHAHHGSGSGATREQALADAAHGWGSFTALEYGQVWGDFRVAHNQTVSCAPSGGGWSCSLTASPCRASGAAVVAAHPAHAALAPLHGAAPAPVALSPRTARTARVAVERRPYGVQKVRHVHPHSVPSGGYAWPGEAR